MIFTIARHEFRGTLRDGRFRWSAVITAVLLGASLLVGWTYQRDLTAQRKAAQDDERGRWERQPNANPHAAAHYGVYAFKPRLATAFLDPGVEPYVGVAVFLEGHSQNNALHRPAEDATALQRFGDLTPALVLQLLLPLLIVAMTFAAVAGERERGVLRQVFVTGLTPLRWMTGKVLGLGAALGLLLVPAAIASGATLFFASDSTSIEGGWLRFGALVACYLAYLLVFLVGAIAISALARSSRSALVALLGLWMVNGLLLPRTAAEFAARRHPVPNAVEFNQRLKSRTAADPHARNSITERMEAELMKMHNVTRPEDLPINRAGLTFLAGEEMDNHAFDEVYGELFDRLDGQNRLRRSFAWLAPSISLQTISLALAGTDFVHHRDFLQAAESHRRLMMSLLNTYLMLHGPKDGSVYRADRALWATIPPFGYRPPAPGTVLVGLRGPLFALAAWLIAAAALFAWAARRLAPL